MKCCSHNQQTLDCGWRVSVGLSFLGKYNTRNIFKTCNSENRNKCKEFFRFNVSEKNHWLFPKDAVA